MIGSFYSGTGIKNKNRARNGGSVFERRGDDRARLAIDQGVAYYSHLRRMDDYLSIQEFSKISGVESSTLRYWDEIGIFTPLKRSPENNYRYYSTAQLLALNFVTTLSELEIPLKTIAELRHERDPENFLELLEKQEHQMDMEMRRLRMRYSIIHARRELINLGMKVDESAISVVPQEEKSMIIWPRNEYNEGDTFLAPLASCISHTSDYHINLSFPVAGYYDNMESFAKAPACPDHFVSIDPIGTFTRKAGDYLVGYARGYYGEVGDLPDRMAAYAAENSLHISGPVFVMYLHEEISTKEPDQYLAQCSVAVSKRRIRDGAAERRRSGGDRRGSMGNRRAIVP